MPKKIEGVVTQSTKNGNQSGSDISWIYLACSLPTWGRTARRKKIGLIYAGIWRYHWRCILQDTQWNHATAIRCVELDWEASVIPLLYFQVCANKSHQQYPKKIGKIPLRASLKIDSRRLAVLEWFRRWEYTSKGSLSKRGLFCFGDRLKQCLISSMSMASDIWTRLSCGMERPLSISWSRFSMAP